MLLKLYRGLRFWFNPFKSLYTKGLDGHSGSPPVEADFLLQESNFDLLQENLDRIIINQG